MVVVNARFVCSPASETADGLYSVSKRKPGGITGAATVKSAACAHCRKT